MSGLAEVRRAFAERLAAARKIAAPRVVAAFAAVPREDFVARGPILAEIVGPRGRVLALEIDPVLCAQARKNLRRWPQVEVRHADGTREPSERIDVVWVHGGVTHAQARWLDALAKGGRLAMPLTAVRPLTRLRRVVRDHAGRLLFLERRGDGFAARFDDVCAMQALLGGRDAALQERLRRAYERGGASRVRSLRIERHEEDASCWLHRDGGCLSLRGVEPPHGRELEPG